MLHGARQTSCSNSILYSLTSSLDPHPPQVLFMRLFGRSFSLHLWQVFALSLSLLILMTVGFVAFFSFRNSEGAIHQLVADRMNLTGDHVQQYLADYLEEPRQINQANATSVKYGDLDLQNLPTLEKRLLGQLQQFDTVSTIFYANPQGILRGAGRDTGKVNLITADYTQKIAFVSYTVDDHGNKLKLSRIIPGIDVRRDRPWYTLAVKTGKPGWTPVFQIANFPILTINAFHPIFDDKNGDLLGVFSVNISLDRISAFLRSHKSDPQSVLFVVDGDGYLIGSAVDQVLFQMVQTPGKQQFQRMRPQDSSHPLIRQTEKYLNAQLPNWHKVTLPQQLEFRDQRDHYYVQIRPFSQPNGLNWMVVEAIPESSLMGPIKVNTYRTILLCGIFLIMAILGAIGIARWITQPLERLSLASQRLGLGDFQPVAIHSPLWETRSLTATFNQMARQLAFSFAEMQSLNTQLLQKEALLQEALRQSETQFQEAFNTAAIGMGILSLTGDFLRVNPSLCQMLGYDTKDLLNLPFHALHEIEEDTEEWKLQKQLLDGDIAYYHLEQRYRHHHGQSIWGLLSVALVRDRHHHPLYFVIQIQNISRQKEAEAALQQSNIELQKLVRIDPLTQVFNRRWFAHQLDQEWRRSQRESIPLSLILLDVDYFKLYNDTYGHPTGDRCLIAVAQGLKHTVQRPVDLVARYGGEEFVVILPHTDLGGAIAVAQKIQEAIRELAILHEASKVSNQVTVSLGVATMIPDGDTSSDVLIAMADQALYQAKQRGRNGFMVAQEVLPERAGE